MKKKKSNIVNKKSKNKKVLHVTDKKNTNRVSKQSVSSKPKPSWVPFNSNDRVLLVGEGDLSFSLSLLECNICSSVTATCLDSQEEMIKKYPEKSLDIIEKIKDYEDSTTIFGIDATKLSSYKKKITSHDVVVFNFPHLGNSMSDQDRNIRQHQEFMLKFFKSAQTVASRIIVTLWEGEPYDSWQIKKLARSVGLHLQQSGKFPWNVYEGYNHVLTSRIGNTSKPQTSRSARMYLFSKQQTMINAKKHDNSSDDD